MNNRTVEGGEILLKDHLIDWWIWSFFVCWCYMLHHCQFLKRACVVVVLALWKFCVSCSYAPTDVLNVTELLDYGVVVWTHVFHFLRSQYQRLPLCIVSCHHRLAASFGQCKKILTLYSCILRFCGTWKSFSFVRDSPLSWVSLSDFFLKSRNFIYKSNIIILKKQILKYSWYF